MDLTMTIRQLAEPCVFNENFVMDDSNDEFI
jgi:hypothetical protein